MQTRTCVLTARPVLIAYKMPFGYSCSSIEFDIISTRPFDDKLIRLMLLLQNGAGRLLSRRQYQYRAHGAHRVPKLCDKLESRSQSLRSSFCSLLSLPNVRALNECDCGNHTRYNV